MTHQKWCIVQLSVYGNGSIDMVRFNYDADNETHGHLFVVENVNGKVRFVAPQDPNRDAESFFTNKDTYGFEFACILRS